MSKITKETIIRRTIALIGVIIAVLVIPCLMGFNSESEIWVNSHILEWSNGHFWRGFFIGGIFEAIFAFVCWSISYFIDKDL